MKAALGRVIWAVRSILTVAIGLWAAAVLVPGFRVGNAHLPSWLAAVVVAGVVAAIAGVLVVLPIWLLARAPGRRPRPPAGAVDEPFVRLKRPGRHLRHLPVAWFVVAIIVVIALAPVALWAGIWLSGQLGVPVTLTGFWPAVVAGLVFLVVVATAAEVLEVLTQRPRSRWALLAPAVMLLHVAGLWLAVALLGGVQLEPAPGAEQALTLVVLARCLAAAELEFAAPFLTTVLRVAGNALKLWVVAWLSTWMEVTLTVQGFWTLVLAALIYTVATWLERLAVRPGPPLDDPFPSHARFSPTDYGGFP